MIDVQHGIPVPYRTNGRWMFNDNTLKVLRKMKDNTGAPLWTQGDITKGIPGALAGAGYVINPDAPDMAAGAKSVIYGDFSTYRIRDVLALRIQRLNELFAANGQVAFLGFQRSDGRLLSASTPIVAYRNSAA